MNIETLLEQLGSRDHFVVCRALKELAKLERPSEKVLKQVVSILASGVDAVEKNALKTLAAFGDRSLPIHGALLKQLCRRVEDGKGCTYDCCGFAAYYAPVELYIETLLSMTCLEGVIAELQLQVTEINADTFGEVRYLLEQF